ncbi:lysosomal Pro-X carboxypeptidase [Rhodnius prolixus]|uniref:Lysosomal Pro-X carboxypeptidase n=2 Tax=Rhodnius prolixus TaxID=13249 RepID=T1HA51_RHOPR
MDADILILTLVLFNCNWLVSSDVPRFVTKYADVALDHFNFVNNATFKLRYLVNDTFWNEGGPIFFYTGNEGDISLFAENTGYMWETAPEFEALVVFAEHRYYGESMPFGNKSLTDPKYSGYLSSSQALADYVDVINIVKKEFSATDSKVIAFGGSYGGMLASWMRMKYPAVITGAVAASAPIWQFTSMTPCDSYNRITSSVFAEMSPGCDRFIKRSWTSLNTVGSSDGGREWLSAEFKTCTPIKTVEDLKTFKDWLSDLYGILAMVNYPYPANFLAPLPAYPVKEVCSNFRNVGSSDKDILRSLFKGISIYFNGTGTAKCLSLVDSDKLGTESWDYQSCTEMIMPMCTDDTSTMFEKKVWDIDKVSNNCFKQFKVRPSVNLVRDLYGGKNIKWATNIIFSNGLLDPWSGGGVTYNVSKTAIAVLIPGASHHLDLRFSNPKDPVEIIEVRKYYKNVIRRWMGGWATMKKEVKTVFAAA